MTKRSLQLILLLSMAVGFVFIATRVFLARFESGDLYPKYSTFRSDPFGSRALLMAYRQLQRVSVDVASDPVRFDEETDGQGRVVIVLGLPMWVGHLPAESGETLERLAENGATVVIAASVDPRHLASESTKEEDVDSATSPDESSDRGSESDKAPESLSTNDWAGLQPIDLHRIESERLDGLASEERIMAHPSVSVLKEPMAFGVPVALEFEANSEWSALYEYQGNIVAAERKVGKGRFILFSDSYPFSNEGLLNDASSELLAWIVKDKQRVTFYESHLGVEEYYGLIALARLYGFDAALILFVVASGAFVWRGTFSPLPKYREADGESGLIDIDAVDLGLNGLLSRSVDRKSLAPAIHARWKKSIASRKISKGKIERIDQVLQAYKDSGMKPGDLTRFYNGVVAILDKKGMKGSS